MEKTCLYAKANNYEYFTKNDLLIFKNSIFNECTQTNKFLTSSNKKIEII